MPPKEAPNPLAFLLIDIRASRETEAKTLLPMVGAFPRNLIFFNLTHSKKALLPILVTVSGIVILFRLLH